MNDGPEWFAPKRYGYGTGWPIAWQGWAVLAISVAIVVTDGLTLEHKPAVQAAIVFPAIAALVIVTARTTRGGWRWRWGEKD